MKSLGPCRETGEQQREYLLDLATRFQSTTFLAVAARYGADDLFDRIRGLKLATIVVDRNTIFADDVWKKGHTMTFSQGEQSKKCEDDAVPFEEVGLQFADDGDDDAGDDDGDDDDGDDDDGDDDAGDDDAVDDDAEDSEEGSYRVRLTVSDPELDEILHDDCNVPAPKPMGIMLWLDQVYKGSRGFELGTFDASILPNIWKKQSANWNDLALGYVSDIVSHVHNFIVKLLSALCEDRRVQSALLSVLMDGLVERYKKSIDHAYFILHVEKLGTPLTANHYFSDNLEK